MANIKRDQAALNAAPAEIIIANLNEFLEGTAEDIDQYGRVIAARLAIAARRDRPDLVEECRDQLALLVDEGKLRVREGKDEAFNWFLFDGLGLITGLISKVLLSLVVVP